MKNRDIGDALSFIHLQAAVNGDLETLKSSVTTRNVNQIFYGPVVNPQTGVVISYFVTLLYLAAQHGHTRMVLWLKNEKGADVNIPGIKDMTPLFAAIYYQHFDTAVALMEYVTDIDYQNSMGETAISMACFCGTVEMVNALIVKGANLNIVENNGYYPISYAAQKGDAEMLQLLASKGANINVKAFEGVTPLMIAIALRHTAAAKTLIELGANINIPHDNGIFPIHYAALCGDLETLKLLVTDYNVDQLTGNAVNKTPVYLAAQGGHTEVVQWLKNERGADINLWGVKGMTPIFASIAHNHPETAATLIALGAKVTIPNCFGFFPIHAAAEVGDLATVQLLDSRSEINIPALNIQQLLPIHSAFSKAQMGVMDYLLRKGASINAQSTEGKTPLHLLLAHQGIAVETKLQIVKKYLSEFDLSIKDMAGQTASDYAQVHCPDCIELAAMLVVAAILAIPHSETSVPELEVQEDLTATVEALTSSDTSEVQESTMLGEGVESDCS